MNQFQYWHLRPNIITFVRHSFLAIIFMTQNLFFKILLFPFSLLYDMITRLRNFLYNSGNRRSIKFDLPVINVGNLSVGGTGKTPHVEYLINLLKDKVSISTLSRGYGRKTKGIIIADENATAKNIGDEPMQFYNKFHKQITVAVGEERALAIPTILFEKPETNVIILDDAFQHRAVVPSLNILLTDYNKLFYQDFVLPAGRLREARIGAKRADIIIVTKCQDTIRQEEIDEINKNISYYKKKETPVFFSCIKYGDPEPIYESSLLVSSQQVVLFSGIANSVQLSSYVKQHFQLKEELIYSDHHEYSSFDIEKILKTYEKYNTNGMILTTEKDMVKLQSSEFKEMLKGFPVFYLPIKVAFLEDKSIFDNIILKECNIF